MTQEATPVGGEAMPVEPTNPADVFTRIAEEEFGTTDEQEPAEGEPAEGADDELEIEEEADDLPPIDAPVSWDAEAKAKFAELPRDIQEVVAKRETDRERFVQTKSQEAARARQDAEQAAIEQLAQIQARQAQEYQQLAASIEAVEPDPMLQVTDPVAYAQQMRSFRQAAVQRQAAQRQAQQYAEQAQARAMQAEQANRSQQWQIIVESFPEYADPTTRPEIQRKLTAVAKELGYPDEVIGQARASDVLAMKQAAEWRDDALKYRQLQSRKMEKVRAAKGLPRVATPGVAQGPDQLRTRNAQSALEIAKSSKNRDVQGAAFFDYLANSGQIKR